MTINPCEHIPRSSHGLPPPMLSVPMPAALRAIPLSNARVNDLYNDSDSEEEDFFITDENANELTAEQIQKITTLASSQIRKSLPSPPDPHLPEPEFHTYYPRTPSQPLTPPVPPHIQTLVDLDSDTAAKSSLVLKDNDDDYENGRAVAPPRPMSDFVGLGIRGRSRSVNNGGRKPSSAGVTPNASNGYGGAASEPVPESYGTWHTSSIVTSSNTSSNTQAGIIATDVATPGATDTVVDTSSATANTADDPLSIIIEYSSKPTHRTLPMPKEG
ncbi:hypothetical protein SeMB42_g00187 [Synchytrium endobioticum]|uniref:Uncharacterized protein n=1 Tax=Synchytrium endobioticum TaxID=286115 RepID=A0A507DSY3_9FUNG|nr:hypothetical protein SeMB42_g00187 [Synchytrium endobioticum]